MLHAFVLITTVILFVETSNKHHTKLGEIFKYFSFGVWRKNMYRSLFFNPIRSSLLSSQYCTLKQDFHFISWWSADSKNNETQAGTRIQSYPDSSKHEENENQYCTCSKVSDNFWCENFWEFRQRYWPELKRLSKLPFKRAIVSTRSLEAIVYILGFS